MSIKAVKKIRKLKDELDKLHEKEDDLLFKIDEVIDELEDSDKDQDVESGYPIFHSNDKRIYHLLRFIGFHSSLSVIFMQQCDIYITLVPT